MTSPLPRIRCREIAEGDIDGVVNLLTRGFRTRRRDFWVRAFRRLAEHQAPCGFPRYGYLLESAGTPVGVLVLLFASMIVDGEERVRCNVSSWYVEPEFRSYATMLVSRALKHKQVTYINVTPGPHTLPILEAQGYVRYCEGRFIAVPALSAHSEHACVEVVAPDIRAGADLSLPEIKLLRAHAKYGCISLICSAADGNHPFVFAVRRKFGLLPFAQLVYSRDLDEFVRFAGVLGRFLARRGIFLAVVDSNGPVAGLVGWYGGPQPKYFKGPHKPRLGDLAYSERAMFGV